MSGYFIDRFIINKNGNRQRVFYTGIGITFSRSLQDAKIFDKIERARESVKYLNDCNMTVYIIKVTDDKQDVVYSAESDKEDKDET